MKAFLLLFVLLALCVVPLRAADPATPAGDAGTSDPRDFPRPAGLVRTSYSESKSESRVQEIANYHSHTGLDEVLAGFRCELTSAGWKDLPPSDSGTGLNRVVITDWKLSAREAELRFYANRKGGSDVWVRVNTYPAASGPVATVAPKPPATATTAAAGVTPATNSAVLIVPNVLGKPVKDAEWFLQGGGFTVRWSEAQQEPAGPNNQADQVAAQDPAAGQRVARGSVVTLKARQYMARVPNVVGLTTQRASESLRDHHLQAQAGPDEATTDRAQVGKVSATQPAAGVAVRVGSTVVVTSRGLAGPVPNVVGKTVTEATNLLQGPPSAPHFMVEEMPPQAVTGPGQQPGKVAVQDPAAGTLTLSGKTVRLTAWAELVRVPNLVGQRHVAGGRQSLNPGPGVHFELQFGPPRSTTDPLARGKVAEQSPAANEHAINGSTITVSCWAITGPVPNVVGKLYLDAQQALRSGPGGTPKFTAQAGPGQPTRDRDQAGRIAQQTPAAGASAMDGSTVVLSKWVLVQKLPSYVGVAIEHARRGLEQMEYQVRLAPARPCIDPALDGTVAAQNPAAGTLLAQEETVTLTVYRLKPE